MRCSNIFSYFFIIFSFYLIGCSYKHYIPKGDLLYDGADIKVVAPIAKAEEKEIKNAVRKLIKPDPNKKILGARVKLSLYNWGNKGKKKKGLRALIKNKFGEAPVLFSMVNPKVTREVITARLFNMGYFKSNVTFNTTEKDSTIRATYIILPNQRYTIEKYTIEPADAMLQHLISKDPKKAELKVGKPYELDDLKKERERIDGILKEHGYYFFNSDYLLYKIDTSSGSGKVSLELFLKPDVPAKGLQVYTMDSVNVFLDSGYVQSSAPDTMEYYMNKVTLKLNRFFNPKPISKYSFLKEGDLYKRANHQLTLNRLMGMAIFKYVNVDLKEVNNNKLRTRILLNPLPRKSLTLEVQAVTKSNNFVGPGVNVNYVNRNFLRGGERLNVNFRGAIETQLNGEFKGLYTFEVGPQISLTIPRFILPFPVTANSLYTPQTFVSTDFSFLRRVNYFDMRSLKVSYGYRWKETIAKQHELAPFNITYFNIRNLSDYFREMLIKNPALVARYNDQLIAGITYSYTYNEQVFPEQKNQFYFNGNIDIAGNALALAGGALGSKNKPDGTKTIAGVAYAQYARLDVDLRDYFNLNKKNKLVARMIVGIGLPYGNSRALPYIKGFFSGGASSLRAFPVNSVGPGNYRIADSLQGAYFLQPGGDLKLEWNLEYRFPIISIIKGALFADAGNTWLARTSYDNGVGRFNKNTYLREIAMGAGFGIRADLNFFVIRLDLATPLRKPWRPAGDRWVLGEFNLKDKDWRGENLILNIAIGYPF